MIYILDDTTRVKQLFEGWQETLIYSCLQKVMGKVFVTDMAEPEAAMAYVGCFAFFAGEPNEELVRNKLDDFVIMVPQNEAWASIIEKCYPDSNKIIRYATTKNTKFDVPTLKKIVSSIPEEYEIRRIDSSLYDLCLDNPATRDFVSAYEDKEMYLKLGRGVVVMREGKIVSGASSYSRYNEGIEIEVDTIEAERRKGLALISSAALILWCLEERLYPSWDAQNMISIHLAEKLGYEFSHEYIAYEVAGN